MIEIINAKQAKNIIETCKPKGSYLVIVSSGSYIGIDNSTCKALTGEFKDLKMCIKWIGSWSLKDLNNLIIEEITEKYRGAKWKMKQY